MDLKRYDIARLLQQLPNVQVIFHSYHQPPVDRTSALIEKRIMLASTRPQSSRYFNLLLFYFFNDLIGFT